MLYLAKISGERLQDHWSSGLFIRNIMTTYEPRCEKTGLRGFRPGPTQKIKRKVLSKHISAEEIRCIFDDI